MFLILYPYLENSTTCITISLTIQWIIKQFPHLKIGSRKVIDRGSAPIWHPGFYLKSADNQGNCCQWIQKEISQNGHRGNLRSILSSDYQCNMWLSRNGLESVEFLYIECKTKSTWMWCLLGILIQLINLYKKF